MGVQEIISIHSVYALLLVITLGAVRGSVPAVSKVVVLSGLDPVLYAATISLTGGFLLLSINLIIGKITPLTMQVIRFSLIGGFVGITIPHIIFFNGIKTVDVGIASAMISGIPIMIYLLSLICKQEIFTFRRFAGVLFGLVGVAIIAGSEITRDSLLIILSYWCHPDTLIDYFLRLKCGFHRDTSAQRLFPHASSGVDDDLWLYSDLALHNSVSRD